MTCGWRSRAVLRPPAKNANSASRLPPRWRTSFPGTWRTSRRPRTARWRECPARETGSSVFPSLRKRPPVSRSRPQSLRGGSHGAPWRRAWSDCTPAYSVAGTSATPLPSCHCRSTFRRTGCRSCIASSPVASPVSTTSGASRRLRLCRSDSASSASRRPRCSCSCPSALASPRATTSGCRLTGRSPWSSLASLWRMPTSRKSPRRSSTVLSLWRLSRRWQTRKSLQPSRRATWRGCRASAAWPLELACPPLFRALRPPQRPPRAPEGACLRCSLAPQRLQPACSAPARATAQARRLVWPPWGPAQPLR
mmetsp:Transcript_116103/g.375143  ORF Transcript_116103/g.375143 Transcript_116103/m.375143 type:complete len:309 (+) Transcript_116103:1143-2069(+)